MSKFLDVILWLLVACHQVDLRHLSTRVVHTRYGTLRGLISTLSNRQLQPVEVFLGVPYAGAPVGALRFMPPVTSPHWRGVRSVDSLPPVCPQRGPDLEAHMPGGRRKHLLRLIPHLVNQSEDCLYLNIYVPAAVSRSPEIRLPVLVFIHGGSFEWGSGNLYDGRVLASRANIIAVTLNYRLGVLGFLGSVDASWRGNYGLLDQVAALHWIQDNIVEFGGDPQNVTVFGQGHGAAHINLLMISPMATGLFRRAILQSGSALCPWAISQDGSTSARALAQHLNCSTQDSRALVECLRKLPLEDLLQGPSFSPTVDGLVVPGPPSELMGPEADHFNRFDLMVGVTAVEGEDYFSILDSEEKAKAFDVERRDQLLKTLVLNLFTHHKTQIFHTIVNEYMEWSVSHLRPEDIFHGTVAALGDATVVAPLLRTALLHSEQNKHDLLPHTKTYFYVFEHHTQRSDYVSGLGCLPGEELQYVFGAPLETPLAYFVTNYTEEEIALTQTTIAHWTSFAKFGDPNLGGEVPIDVSRGRYHRVTWPEFTSTHQKYLSISPRPQVRDHYRAHKLSYWLRLIPQLDTLDNYSDTSHHELHELTSIDATQDIKHNVTKTGFPSVLSILEGRFSALGFTVAVGFLLLMLNALLFAAILRHKSRPQVSRDVEKPYVPREEILFEDTKPKKPKCVTFVEPPTVYTPPTKRCEMIS